MINSIPLKAIEFPICLGAHDLILSKKTKVGISQIEFWLKSRRHKAETDKSGRINGSGYRAIFYGPVSSGKLRSACRFSKEFNGEVCRVDLYKLITEYPEETEQKLTMLFDKAKKHNWIFFFDEADALFGKRITHESGQDEYANIEVSHLLQLIDSYPGLVLLSFSLKGNISDYLATKFNTIVEFDAP